jgi:uncharacterized protein GlcG (DUF336 family)
MKFIPFVAIAGATAILALSASEQGVPAKKGLTLGMAQTMAEEALATCRSKGIKVTVLVVDGLNMPKALLRDDGAPASSTETAKMKATTAMLYDRPSGPVQPLPPGAMPPPAIIPGTVNAPGAFPIKIDDVTIGAIAVSGAPHSEQDADCAAAALAKVANQLKYSSPEN